ncbi:MAG TPA: GDSL-type esterase/lipase family protein [Gemmatimonadaceae bacterium]|nr:GDSL-type esterase/lipase family protein [Gemmatimonadaceae bacterium]
MSARFLALGDSYTLGEGIAPAGRWPAQLARLVRAHGVRLQTPELVAATGWTTSDVLAALRTEMPSAPFDLISLLIGVNDQYRGLSPAHYRSRFRELLLLAITLADNEPRRVLVLSIPDWGATPFGARDPRGTDAISMSIDQFNRENHGEATAVGTQYADVTQISRQAAGVPAMLTADQLHPSAAMYARWARRLLAVSLAVLGDAELTRHRRPGPALPG